MCFNVITMECGTQEASWRKFNFILLNVLGNKLAHKETVTSQSQTFSGQGDPQPQFPVPPYMPCCLHPPTLHSCHMARTVMT